MRYLWAIPIVILGCSSESTQDESTGPGWSVLKEFSPVVTLPRDGLLRLHYAMTGGAAVFDADLDGDLDIFLTGTSAQTPQTYWEQTGPLVFENRTNGSGLESAVFGVGATAGDIDGDGDSDLIVTGLEGTVLYRSQGDGTFVLDQSFQADNCASSATFVDFDLDGDLDLYVCRYANIALNPDKECRDAAGRLEFCGPTAYPPLHDLLFENNGEGSFEDVTAKHQIDRVAAAGLGVTVDDLTGDGRLDLYIANDGYENHLWVMTDEGLFEEQAARRGLAVNLMGETEAGMGVVSLDVNQDLLPDLFCTHLAAETNTLYVGSQKVFLDATAPKGLGSASVPKTGFGVVARDFNRDGFEDLLVGNGRVARGDSIVLPDLEAPWNGMAESNDLYLGGVHGFTLAEPDAVLNQPNVTRAVVAADLDRLGGLEILVVNVETPTQLLTPPKTSGRELFVEAVDEEGRPVLHTLVVAKQRDQLQRRRQGISDGYASAQAPEVHFGFADSLAPVELSIRWPDGAEERFSVPDGALRFQAQRGQGQ